MLYVFLSEFLSIYVGYSVNAVVSSYCIHPHSGKHSEKGTYFLVPGAESGRIFPEVEFSGECVGEVRRTYEAYIPFLGYEAARGVNDTSGPACLSAFAQPITSMLGIARRSDYSGFFPTHSSFSNFFTDC